MKVVGLVFCFELMVKDAEVVVAEVIGVVVLCFKVVVVLVMIDGSLQPEDAANIRQVRSTLIS